MTKYFKEIINEVLQKYYPIPDNFDNISQLSHFHMENITNFQQWLPFNVDIRGVILSGSFMGERIQIVQTADYSSHTWNQYVELFHSILPQSEHYCINTQKFLWNLHTCPHIKMLRIASIKLQHNDIFMIPIVYIGTLLYQIAFPNIPNNPKLYINNHFYLNSFDIKSNQPQLTKEIKRLFLHRDKYDDIHFHLDNNCGGDNTPGQLIVQCLVGPRESWMKPVTKIMKNKTEFTWDEWSEGDPETDVRRTVASGDDAENVVEASSPESPANYGQLASVPYCLHDTIQALQLGKIPTYNTKYAGKIYVYMNPQNGSAAWFFITYLVYAFAKKQDIIRHKSSCFGNTYKHGTVLPNHQLFLRGMSGTASGDGNAEPVIVRGNNMNILVYCPTEQFISSSILPEDWNRYWSEG